MSRTAPAVTVLGVNYPPEPTGIAPYTGAMARGLSGRNFRVHVVTAHPHYPEWRVTEGYGQRSRSEHLDGVSLERVSHYVPTRPTGIRRLVSELSFGIRLIAARWRNPSAIVVISPALFSSALATIRARIFHRSTPVIVWVQDLYWLGLRETGQATGLSARIIKSVEGWLLRTVDTVVVIHDRFADRIEIDYGVARERIRVVRNWTHLSPPTEIDRVAARAERGWDGETVVLHAGNMGVKQGLENVVEAARLAANAGQDIRFVLMGGGAERDRLRASGADVATLEFVDPLPEGAFARALHAADVLLVNELPGVSEMAVPSKLTSYFSAGRPVVAATDITGITAAEVRAAEAGVVVEAGKPNALLAASLELGSNRERSNELGANGKRYCDTVLDETFAIDSFATLLATLIEEDRARPSRTAGA